MDMDMEKIQKNVMKAFGIEESKTKEENKNEKYSKEYIKNILGF